MANLTVDPEVVIHHLSTQVGQLATDLAITRAALDAAHARIAALEQSAGTAQTAEETP